MGQQPNVKLFWRAPLVHAASSNPTIRQRLDKCAYAACAHPLQFTRRFALLGHVC